MKNVTLVEGHLIDEETVKLDEKVPMHNGRVSVMVEFVEIPQPRRSLTETMAYIRGEQARQNFVPSTREAVDARLSQERSSWE